MWPDCQLRAFNAEITGSCTIALSPCFHSCPSTLVPSFGGWREWLRWIAYCPFFSGQELPRTRRSSTISPSSCGPSLVILGRFPPRLGPWAYYSEWAGAPRSFGPTGPILSILFGLIRHIRSYLVHFGLKIASIRNKHYFFLKKTKPKQNKTKPWQPAIPAGKFHFSFWSPKLNRIQNLFPLSIHFSPEWVRVSSYHSKHHNL